MLVIGEKEKCVLDLGSWILDLLFWHMCIHTCIHTCILDPGSFVVDIICILPLDLLCWILDLGSCRCRCCKYWIFSLTHVGSYQSHCIGIGSFIVAAIGLNTSLGIDSFRWHCFTMPHYPDDHKMWCGNIPPALTMGEFMSIMLHSFWFQYPCIVARKN